VSTRQPTYFLSSHTVVLRSLSWPNARCRRSTLAVVAQRSLSSLRSLSVSSLAVIVFARCRSPSLAVVLLCLLSFFFARCRSSLVVVVLARCPFVLARCPSSWLAVLHLRTISAGRSFFALSSLDLQNGALASVWSLSLRSLSCFFAFLGGGLRFFAQWRRSSHKVVGRSDRIEQVISLSIFSLPCVATLVLRNSLLSFFVLDLKKGFWV